MIEACLNVVVGFGVAVAGQLIIFPALLGVTPQFTTNLYIGACFTAISLLRSYALRRLLTGRKWLTEEDSKTCPTSRH